MDDIMKWKQCYQSETTNVVKIFWLFFENILQVSSQINRETPLEIQNKTNKTNKTNQFSKQESPESQEARVDS